MLNSLLVIFLNDPERASFVMNKDVIVGLELFTFDKFDRSLKLSSLFEDDNDNVDESSVEFELVNLLLKFFLPLGSLIL